MLKVFVILAVFAAVYAGNYGQDGPKAHGYSHTYHSKPIVVKEVKVVKDAPHYRYGHNFEVSKGEKKEESSESSEEKQEEYAHGPHGYEHGYKYGVPHALKVKIVKGEKDVTPVPVYSSYRQFGYGPHHGQAKEEKKEEKLEESSESSEEKTVGYQHGHGVPYPPKVKREKVEKPLPIYGYGRYGYGPHRGPVKKEIQEEKMAESSESSAEKDVGYGNGPQGHGHGYDISYAPKVKVVKVEKPAPVHSYDPAKEKKKEENMEESSEEKIVEHGHGYGGQHDPKIHVVKVENVVRPAASYSYGVGYGYGHGQGHQYVTPKEKKKEESSESSEEKKEESSESSEEKIVGYRHGYRHGYRYGIPYEKPAPVHSYGHGYGYDYGHGHRYGPVKDETKEEKKEESSESSEEKMEGYGHGYGVPHVHRVHIVKLEKIIKPAPSYSYVINGGYGHHYEAPKEEKVEENKKESSESSESSEEKTEGYGHEYRRGYAYGVPHAPGVHVVKVEKVIKPAPSYSYGIGHHGYGHHGHGYRHGYGNGFVYAPRTEVVKPTPSYSYGHGYYGHGYGHGHGRSYFTPAAAKKVVVQEVKVSEPKGAAPYKFGYDIVDEHGNKQSRHESGDAAGNKKGSYTFDLVDGRKRIVDYVADGNGFKAVVRSNEPGTDPSKDPADVQKEPLGEPLKVVEASKAPEPVKEVKDVKVAPSYGYGAGHYDHHGHGHGYGNGYGHGYRHGGYSKVYNKQYEAPRHSYYRRYPASTYQHSYKPSYSYGNTYAPAGAFRYWW